MKAIIGAGGFGREIYWSLPKNQRVHAKFFVDDEYYKEDMKNSLPISMFDPLQYEAIVAVAECKVRQKIVESLPKNTVFFKHIHESVQIHDRDVNIGEGSIICAGVIITTNITLGKHTHLNLSTTVGHDCTLGDYLTTAPTSSISGNCVFGQRVYLGTHACVKQKVKICDDVIVGMNSGVIHDINEPGTYVGTPARKL